MFGVRIVISGHWRPGSAVFSGYRRESGRPDRYGRSDLYLSEGCGGVVIGEPFQKDGFLIATSGSNQRT